MNGGWDQVDASWAVIRSAAMRWDPIGISQVPGTPVSAYDALVIQAINGLEDGLSDAEIARALHMTVADWLGYAPLKLESMEYEEDRAQIVKFIEAVKQHLKSA